MVPLDHVPQFGRYCLRKNSKWLKLGLINDHANRWPVASANLRVHWSSANGSEVHAGGEHEFPSCRARLPVPISRKSNQDCWWKKRLLPFSGQDSDPFLGSSNWEYVSTSVYQMAHSPILKLNNITDAWLFFKRTLPSLQDSGSSLLSPQWSNPSHWSCPGIHLWFLHMKSDPM